MKNTKIELKESLEKVLKAKELDYQKLIELSTELSKFDENYLRFSIDANTLVSLGRESIKNHTTALIELVKNSYDANAQVVEIDIICDEKKEYIRIADNGTGMSSKEVLENWLRIGYSEKRKNKKNGKRRVTGEKGIGRLSADRLGSTLTLISKAEKKEICGLNINWDDFQKENTYLNNVKMLKIQNPKIKLPMIKNTESNTGTELIITNLRQIWTDKDLENLYHELSILMPPNKTIKDFKIVINSNIESDYKGEIEPPFRQSAEVEICVDYKGTGSKIEYIIKDKYKISDEEEYSIEWGNLMDNVDDPRKYPVRDNLKCGPVIFEIKFYPKNASMVKGTKFKLGDLKEFLNKYHGVKIYRDDICVKPYGFPGLVGSDWLDLGERQGKDPAGIDRPSWKVKPYQLVGEVYISRDINFDLTDSAAREGLVNNEEFYDLRALVLSGINLLEIHRYEMYKKLGTKQKKKRTSLRITLEEYKQEINKLKKELEILKKEKQSQSALDNAENQINIVLDKTETAEKTIKNLLNKQRTLAGLATIGISSAVFGHETNSLVGTFKTAAGNAQLYLDKIPPDVNKASINLQKALELSNRISAWGGYALTRIKRDKRKKETKNVKELVEAILREIKSGLKSGNVELNYEQIENFKAKIYPMDIESIIINLITNAFSACLNSPNKERKINIEVKQHLQEEKPGFYISVSDTGLGVDPKLKKIIWEPLFTTKLKNNENIGVGLGLAIVDSIVDDLKGMRSVEKDENLKGAKFIIWLPKR